jgi:hypothetical protein
VVGIRVAVWECKYKRNENKLLCKARGERRVKYEE